MIFPYDIAFDPPAPVLTIEVRDTLTGQSQTIAAKIDTGADGCVIPRSLVTNLALEEFDEFLTSGYDDQAVFEPSYLVDIIFAGYMFTHREVIASALPYALLGRDILNQLVITFDGPQLTFEIQ